jgi:hypothetical protein
LSGVGGDVIVRNVAGRLGVGSDQVHEAITPYAPFIHELQPG